MARARRVTLYNDGASTATSKCHLLRRNWSSARGFGQCASGFSRKCSWKRDRAEQRRHLSPRGRKRETSEPDITLAHFVTTRPGRSVMPRPRPTGAPSSAVAAPSSTRPLSIRAASLAVIRALPSTDRRPAPPGAGAGQQEDIADFLDRCRRQPRRVGKKPSPGSTTRRVLPARRCSHGREARSRTRHMGLSLTDAANVQKLARYLIYPDPFCGFPPNRSRRGLGKQSSLWPTSISGDYPIFLVRIAMSPIWRSSPGASVPGVYAHPRHDDRLRRRQRTGVLLCPGPAEGGRDVV